VLRNILDLAGAGQSYPGGHCISPTQALKMNLPSPLRKGATDSANNDSSYLEQDSGPAAYLETPDGKSCMVAWEMFKRYYLRILFPGTARRVGMVVDDREGFPTCPASILFVLVDFIVRYCLPSTSGRLLDSAVVLNLVIFGNYQSRELIHEIIRQALLLPFSEVEVVKGSIHAIRSWISMNAEDRPAYLRETKVTEGKGLVINAWIKRFIKTLKLTFLERFADGGKNTPNRKFPILIVV
jgi:hypothetical protein